MPTYDEVIGYDGITNDNYNDYLLSLIKPDQLNVLAIHAEVEGIVCNNIFEEFLNKAKNLGISFVSLNHLLNESRNHITESSIINKYIIGRDGMVSNQNIV